MTINIEKMWHDMQVQQKQMDWETRKFVVSMIVAIAAAAGVGVGIGNLIWGHQLPPPPQTIVIQQPAPAPATPAPK
jgi:hypothetical protein